MPSTNLRNLFLQHVAQTSDNPLNIQIDRAEGVYLYSGDKVYIDCISGISVSNLGHSRPEIIDAVNEQMRKHTHLMVYGELVQSPQVLLAKELTALLPDQLNSVYFVNSGSEAIEGAMKLAKRYTDRFRFTAQKLAYHGSTQGALSLMSDPFFSDAFTPLLPGITFMDQNSIEQIEASITHETAAVFIEPIMGEKGYLPCEIKYLKAVRKRCDEVGALLIFDEIQSGYGRTGSLFAFEQFDVIPDVLVLAKGFGGGLPLGAFVSSKEILSVMTHQPVLGHITTFGGHPVSCAASLAALNLLLETKIHLDVPRKSELFKSKLKHPAIKSISGSGFMLAIEFEDAVLCRKIIDACVLEGLLVDWFLFSESKMRIAPPLIMEDEVIARVCGIILDKIQESVQPF
ncbi:MAG TPA: aminotransferase class III-fold pyridoxal phosphate-dependent enzyme [Bacteroidia bacterium]